MFGTGNHDSEIMEDRAYQMKLYQSLPYSLAEPGPANIDGVGNCTYASRLARQPLIASQTSSRSAPVTPLVFTYSPSTSSTRMPKKHGDYLGRKQTTTTSSSPRSTGSGMKAPPSGLSSVRSLRTGQTTSARSGVGIRTRPDWLVRMRQHSPNQTR